jgi:hypothetical protein
MKAIKMILLVAVIAMISSSAAMAGKVVLPEGTEIKVNFDPAMKVNSGKLQTGVNLAIFLAEDIKVGGKTIVEAGAEGVAKVENAVSSSRPGKPGQIVIKFIELGTKGKYTTQENARIKLAGSVEDKGKGRKVLSWLFIFGLFIKGSQGEIDTGQAYPATIAETVVLESD